MRADTHPIEKEQVMAYLDGELAPEQAAGVAMHLDQCGECQRLAAELRAVSSRLLAWNVEPATKGLEDAVLAEPNKGVPPDANIRAQRRLPHGIWWKGLLRNRWVWVGAGAFVMGVLLLFVWPPHLMRSQYALMEPRPTAGVALLEEGVDRAERSELKAPTAGPMIARTASLKISVKDFNAARGSMDRITSAHQGYVASLNLSTEKSAPQSLGAKLAIPAAQCDAALADLRALGRVEQEQQSSEEVSSQAVDLDARLKNARETEGQLAEILRARSGKISDVLEVEKEMSRVRAEIERMEAEQKRLRDRVAFAAIDLNLTEEYQAQLGDGSSGASRRLRNALVDGYHAAADGLLSVFAFLLNVGPTLLVWALILFWPTRWAWRRWRNSKTQSTASA